MAHRSCLAGFIIDCETDDLAGAAGFWAEALGNARRRKPQGKYVPLDRESGLHVEVQKVAHPSRVHLDIASDDIPAEVARLEKLGAKVRKEKKESAKPKAEEKRQEEKPTPAAKAETAKKS